MPSISRRRAITLPILAGPLRGAWWALGSGGKLGLHFLGSYETDQTEVFCRLVKPGDTVIDLGANVGYYTLLGARMVGPGGTVVACEPEPLNAAYLRRHVARNRLANVTVMEAAVGASPGEVRFTRGRGRSRGHISETGELNVPLETLDSIVERGSLSPTHLKIDVEGAELEVLEGGVETLQRDRPVLYLSTHGRDVHEASCGFLAELGYQLSAIDGREFSQARKILAVP